MSLHSSNSSITREVRHAFIVLEPDQEVIPDWVGSGLGKVGERSTEAIYCDVKLVPGGGFPGLSCSTRGTSTPAIDV